MIEWLKFNWLRIACIIAILVTVLLLFLFSLQSCSDDMDAVRNHDKELREILNNGSHR